MLANIQDNTHKAYVALQSYVTSPSNIPIPGVVHTDRPKLTREQMAARYLKSVEGNPNIDINKAESGERNRTPKMVQKPAKSLPEASRLINSDPHTAGEAKTHQTSRTLMETSGCWTGLPLSRYIEIASKSEKLEYNPVDTEFTDEPCMGDLPEFVICRDEYLSMTDVEGWRPRQVLNYRGDKIGDKCGYTYVNCPEPATTPEKINIQINEMLKKDKATRIYLTPTQLDSYLFWRLADGGKINFPHIRVEDKGSMGLRAAVLGMAAIVSISSLSLMAYGVISKCREDSTSNGSCQTITCINRTSADQQAATEGKKAEHDDPAQSSTSSSSIISFEDSTKEDSENTAVMIDIQNDI